MNPKEPFKFLDAYAKEDADIFFGRDAEIEELYSRVFYSKLLLVYGQSGVGKTSVIQCGLANRLGEADALPIFIRHNGDLLQSLTRELNKFAMTPLPASSPEQESAAFVQAVRSLYLDYFKPIFLIFDQFEELFLFSAASEQQRFAAMLAALSEASLECRVILCIREEYLAELTAFEQIIPNLFANRLRVERMNHANALAAITGPCRVCGVRLESGAADDILTRLGGETAGAVELTWLQVVLDKLYHHAAQRAEAEELNLTRDDVAALGSLGNVLAGFLEEQIAAMETQAALGEAVLKTLITPEGTKKTVTVPDVVTLLNSMGTPADAAQITDMVNHFVTVRILREREDAGGYELRHDSLAQHIFERMTALEKDVLEALQMVENRYKEYQVRGTLLDRAALDYVAPYLPRLGFKPQVVEFIGKSRAALTRAKRRLLIALFASLLTVLIVVSGLGILSFTKYREAERQRRNALRTQSLFLTDLAHQENERQEYGNAVLLALEALPKQMNPPEKPFVPEAEVQLYDGLVELQERVVLDEHGSRVSQAMFSPDRKRLLTVCLEQAQVWDIAAAPATGGLTGKRSLVLRSAPNAITQAAFSPDGTQILAVLSNKTLTRWEADSGKELPVFDNQVEGVKYAAFSPNGANIALVLYDNTARIIEAHTGRETLILNGDSAKIEQAAFSADGTRIVTVSLDGAAHVWDVATGAALTALRGHHGAVLHAEFSPDGTRIVTASRDSTARLWNAATGETLKIFEHDHWVEYAAFSADGGRIVTASGNAARVWKAETGEPLWNLRGHADRVGYAAFSPDGTQIVTASWDKTARIWEMNSSLMVMPTPISTETPAASMVTLDGKRRLAIRAEIAHIADAATGAELAEFSGHRGEIKSAAFSPDGTRVATASADKTARLWDAASGSMLMEFRGHERGAVDVAFRFDGKRLVTVSEDGTARMWDAATGKTLAIFPNRFGRIIHAAFSPDGTRIVTTLADGGALAWRVFLTTQALIDYANAVAPRRLSDEQRQQFFVETVEE